MKGNRVGYICIAMFFGCLLTAHATIFARNADVRASLANGEDTYIDCANLSLYTKGMLVVLVLIVFCSCWYLIYNCYPYTSVASGAAYHLMAFAMLDTLIGSASFNVVGTYWLANSGACVAEAPSLYHLALGENILFHLLFDGTLLWATGVLYLVYFERRNEKAERLLANGGIDTGSDAASSNHVPDQYRRSHPSTNSAPHHTYGRNASDADAAGSTSPAIGIRRDQPQPPRHHSIADQLTGSQGVSAGTSVGYNTRE